MNAWNNFNGGNWENEINVRDFIQKNYTPYDGDGAFLAPATARTTALREKFDALLAEEREKGGVRNIDTETVITITAFGPGYLDKDNEVIVGLQTDEPLKRACNPFGGMRMVRDACKQYGYEVSPKIEEEFKYHKTHNDGVFSAYTKDVREARHVGLLTGLPDAYGRGRIIGDYRRVALYGVDRLIEEKQRDKDALGEQMGALGELDYVVDAIDTVAQKLRLAAWCQERGVPELSAMGGANKLDPCRLRFARIEETVNCPLARVMRKECRRRGIRGLRVLFSDEEPVRMEAISDERWMREGPLLGTMSYLPPIMGQMLASRVIRDLLGWE